MSAGTRRTWLAAIASAFLACTVLAGPALSQQPEEPEEGKQAKRTKAEKIKPIDLVVDGVKKHTWSAEALARLASESPEKWKSPTGKPHPAIPIWTLVKEGGVSKDAVTEVRISNLSKTVTVKEQNLAKVDQLVLRNAAKAIARAWRLASMDPTAPKAGSNLLPGVVRIEVITAK